MDPIASSFRFHDAVANKMLSIWTALFIVSLLATISNVYSSSTGSSGNLLIANSTDKVNDPESHRVLMQAVENNDPETIGRLAEKGTDMTMETETGDTLLHVAAVRGSVDAAKKLLELGVPVDSVDVEGKSPLWKATSSGNLKMMDLLREKGADLNMTEGGWWNRTLLHEAALNGKNTAVLWLLDKGLKINQQDNGGWTPLHLAAAAGHTNVVETLLLRGANVTIPDNDGEVPLHESARRGHIAVVELLLNGTNPNAKNFVGVTPLLAAAGKGHKNIVELLINSGGDPSAKTVDGWTALHEVSYGGHGDIVGLLLDRGVRVDSTDKDGWTPLFSAAAMGHTGIVQILTDRGANIRAKANNGNTPLHEAAARGHYNTVKELILRRADVNARTNDGRTPLKVALIWEHSGVADLLRSKGGVL